MAKLIKKIKPVDESKQIRVGGTAHATFIERAAALSAERGRIKPISLPEYLEEASAFFEANRPKVEKA